MPMTTSTTGTGHANVSEMLHAQARNFLDTYNQYRKELDEVRDAQGAGAALLFIRSDKTLVVQYRESRDALVEAFKQEHPEIENPEAALLSLLQDVAREQMSFGKRLHVPPSLSSESPGRG